MPTRWWEGHTNSLLDDWFCVLGAGVKKSFKITTVCQSQVFHSVWFLISIKRGHVSHWKVRYTLNKNSFILNFCSWNWWEFVLKKKWDTAKILPVQEKIVGQEGWFWWQLSFSALSLVPSTGQGWAVGIMHWATLSLTETSCLRTWWTGSLFKSLHPHWVLPFLWSLSLAPSTVAANGCVLVSYHLPRIPVKTFAFQLGLQRNTEEHSALSCPLWLDTKSKMDSAESHETQDDSTSHSDALSIII